MSTNANGLQEQFVKIGEVLVVFEDAFQFYQWHGLSQQH